MDETSNAIDRSFNIGLAVAHDVLNSDLYPQHVRVIALSGNHAPSLGNYARST